MSDKKGFTLIEVILSIAILGIISISFLSAISSHFSFLNRTKVITQDAFLAQREMEEEIDNIKDIIRTNRSSLELEEKTIFDSLGGIKVNYYEIEKSYNNKFYYTIVSDVKPELLEPINLNSIGINLKQQNAQVSYGYGLGNFSVVGNFENKISDKWDHLLNVVEWYVANDQFIIPMPKDKNFNINDDIDYYSYYYPIFPKDYILVSNEIINNFGSHVRTFSKLSEYAGRHVVFTATPGAKSGKIGNRSASLPVFVSGLPITDGLSIHFDANYIDPTDSNEVVDIDDVFKVKYWLDISSIFGRNAPNQGATVFNSYNQPELKKTEMGMEFIGQYVRFDVNQYLRIENQSTDSKTVNVFGVIRNRVVTEASVYLNNETNEFSVPAEAEGIESDWIIMNESFESNSNTFVLGGPNVDIAEIIIYDRELTADQISIIQNYLNSKYK